MSHNVHTFTTAGLNEKKKKKKNKKKKKTKKKKKKKREKKNLILETFSFICVSVFIALKAQSFYDLFIQLIVQYIQSNLVISNAYFELPLISK